MADITIFSQNKGVPVIALCQGLSLPRATYYRNQIEKSAVPTHIASPANALSNELQQTMLDLLHSARFRTG